MSDGEEAAEMRYVQARMGCKCEPGHWNDPESVPTICDTWTESNELTGNVCDHCEHANECHLIPNSPVREFINVRCGKCKAPLLSPFSRCRCLAPAYSSRLQRDGFATPSEAPSGGVCPGVGHVPSALQGVTVATTAAWGPQRCDICGREGVPVDAMFRLTLHERADR